MASGVKKLNYIDAVFYKDSGNMKEVPNNTVQLIVTSPPYFNIKDYSLDGRQKNKITEKAKGQIGDISNYEKYIKAMLPVWKECIRVLKPNGKLVINTPLLPMLKRDMKTHYNRHIFDIDSDIQQSILRNLEELYLMDIYIWNRTNPSKKLMFGSYPFPRNFYAQNTVEFLSVYVKDGLPENGLPYNQKEHSRLSQTEWVEYTKQVWNIPVPNKGDMAFGEHAAIMPEEIVKRFVKLFTFRGELVLDPFAGSGTTMKVAKGLDRKYVGYEISESYRAIIEKKLAFRDKQVRLSLINA